MEIWLFVGALAAIYLMPGPDMILVLHAGALEGRASVLGTVTGLAFARSTHVALAAVGLASLFQTLPWTLDAARLVGAAYLIGIGVQLIRNDPTGNTSSGLIRWSSPPSFGAAWRRGVLTNLLNPKALLFCSILLPQFVVPTHSPMLAQFAVLGAILVLVGMLFDTCFALAGERLARLLIDNAVMQRRQRRVYGALLFGFGVHLGLTSSP